MSRIRASVVSMSGLSALFANGQARDDFSMRDAFGVSKSYLGHGVWKPLSATTKGERNLLLRVGRHTQQGKKGFHAAARGKTAADAKMEEGLRRSTREGERLISDASATFLRRGPAPQQAKVGAGKATTLELPPRGDRPNASHPAFAGSKGNWRPMGSKGGQRRNKGLALVDQTQPNAPEIMRHELGHADRRKPFSATVRRARGGPEGRLAEEARADHYMTPAGRLESGYRKAASGDTEMRAKVSANYGQKSSGREIRRGLRRYKQITRKLEGIEAKRGATARPLSLKPIESPIKPPKAKATDDFV